MYTCMCMCMYIHVAILVEVLLAPGLLLKPYIKCAVSAMDDVDAMGVVMQWTIAPWNVQTPGTQVRTDWLPIEAPMALVRAHEPAVVPPPAHLRSRSCMNAALMMRAITEDDMSLEELLKLQKHLSLYVLGRFKREQQRRENGM